MFIRKTDMMMEMLRFVLLMFLCVGCEKNCSNNNVKEETKSSLNSNQVVGVDQFGRSFGTINSVKKEKQVGMFFWLWIGQPYASGIYDATKILAMPNGLKILTDFNSLDPSISPNGQAHYWGEPLWGYYNSDDEWVIRKQLQMITTAGVDFIFFDASNAYVYKNVYTKVLGIIDEYIKKGWNPPKVVFYTHSHSLQTTRNLYLELYKANVYPDSWYRVNGKPAIIAYTDPADDLAEAKTRGDSQYTTGPLSAEILDFFYFFRPQWPSDPVYADGLPWVEWTFPQPLHTNIMNVTVASHPAIPMSFSLTRGNQNWGRGWNVNTKQNVESDIDKGTFFQSQWDHALSVNPNMLSIGGWNEWIAYKQPWQGEYMLCDAANKEFSRDIEPMNGGYQDAFYLQLIRNIRKYKGVSDSIFTSESRTMDISGDISKWEDIKYDQKNIDDSYAERDSYGGAQTVRYTQAAPVNKLSQIKVAYDSQNLYFYIKCRDNLTQNSETDRINLFLGTGEPSLRGWECYDYQVGRAYNNGDVKISRLNNDFSAVDCGSAKYTINNNIIRIQVPRNIIDLTGSVKKFYFKVATGVKHPSDIMNYYQTGSSMPMGRLSFMYNMQ
jgi:hypothetical protein